MKYKLRLKDSKAGKTIDLKKRHEGKLKSLEAIKKVEKEVRESASGVEFKELSKNDRLMNAEPLSFFEAFPDLRAYQNLDFEAAKKRAESEGSNDYYIFTDEEEKLLIDLSSADRTLLEKFHDYVYDFYTKVYSDRFPVSDRRWNGYLSVIYYHPDRPQDYKFIPAFSKGEYARDESLKQSSLYNNKGDLMGGRSLEESPDTTYAPGEEDDVELVRDYDFDKIEDTTQEVNSEEAGTDIDLSGDKKKMIGQIVEKVDPFVKNHLQFAKDRLRELSKNFFDLTKEEEEESEVLSEAVNKFKRYVDNLDYLLQKVNSDSDLERDDISKLMGPYSLYESYESSNMDSHDGKYLDYKLVSKNIQNSTFNDAAFSHLMANLNDDHFKLDEENSKFIKEKLLESLDIQETTVEDAQEELELEDESLPAFLSDREKDLLQKVYRVTGIRPAGVKDAEDLYEHEYAVYDDQGITFAIVNVETGEVTKTTREDLSVNAKSYENMAEVMSAAQALESNFNGSADSGYVQLEDGKTVGIYYQDSNGNTALNLEEVEESLDPSTIKKYVGLFENANHYWETKEPIMAEQV